jgi:environmental stress-induced protein Ves
VSPTGPLVLRHDDLAVTPWHNGGGVTREVASGRFPGGQDGEAAATPFDWRISIADVATAGPFSALTGVDRVITLVEGELMVLVVDGRQAHLRLHEPFAFPGEAATTCELPQGRTRDLNLMTRRGRCTGSVEVLVAHGPHRLGPVGTPAGPPAAGIVAVVGLSGTTWVAVDGRTEPLRLAPLDTCLLGDTSAAVVLAAAPPAPGAAPRTAAPGSAGHGARCAVVRVHAAAPAPRPPA